MDADDEMPVKKGKLLFTLGGPSIDTHLIVLREKIALLKKRVTLAENMAAAKRKAVTQKLARQEELVSAEDALALLQVELESARQEMQFLEDAAHIRATRSGAFSNRTISAGQNVEKNDNLAEVISVKNLRVTATLFPRHETKLVGKRATINLPEGGSISGTVVKEFPQRTSEAATIVRIEGRDLNRYMKPGDTVNGNIVLLLHKAVLSVPQSAIIRDEKEKTYVFLKRSGNFTKHPVKTGIKSDSWIEVLSGLKEKDEIVVQGAYELFYRNFNKIYKALD